MACLVKGIKIGKRRFTTFSENYEKKFRKLEEKYSFKYPSIVWDLLFYTKDYFIYSDIPAYRQICHSRKIENDIEMFINFSKEYGEDYEYFTNKKNPIFGSDGNLDLLDLTQYDPELDDCPIAYFDHEDQSPDVLLFPSVKRYLELLTIEFKSNDSYDMNIPGDHEKYIERMKTRGTEELLRLQ